MRVFSVLLIPNALTTILVILFVCQAGAAGPKVSEYSSTGNKHNLSARAWQSGLYNTTNPNTYKATDDPSGNPRGQQICIFCHTPHNANVVGQAPLWNRKFSSETFQRYSGSAQFQIKNLAAAQYGSGAQPNGSSKLCLSCHDGVSNLGELLSGPSIDMVGGTTPGVIEGYASFKSSTNKMRYGHHPVSFVYNQSVATSINDVKGTGQYILPPVSPDPLAVVKLDRNSQMQCTTCHNAHQNLSDDADCYGGPCGATSRKKAPFWVYHAGSNTASQDRDAVCRACHALTIPLPGSPMTP